MSHLINDFISKNIKASIRKKQQYKMYENPATHCLNEELYEDKLQKMAVTIFLFPLPTRNGNGLLYCENNNITLRKNTLTATLSNALPQLLSKTHSGEREELVESQGMMLVSIMVDLKFRKDMFSGNFS